MQQNDQFSTAWLPFDKGFKIVCSSRPCVLLRSAIGLSGIRRSSCYVIEKQMPDS
jgi:hypothetical protein